MHIRGCQRESENEEGEKSPRLVVGKPPFPSVTKMGSSKHLLLILQIKLLPPAKPSQKQCRQILNQ